MQLRVEEGAPSSLPSSSQSLNPGLFVTSHRLISIPFTLKEAARYVDALRLTGTCRDDRRGVGGKVPQPTVGSPPITSLRHPCPDSIPQLTAGSSGFPKQKHEQEDRADTFTPRPLHLDPQQQCLQPGPWLCHQQQVLQVSKVPRKCRPRTSSLAWPALRPAPRPALSGDFSAGSRTNASDSRTAVVSHSLVPQATSQHGAPPQSR